MFSSKTCFLFTVLTIIPKSGTNVLTARPEASHQNETDIKHKNVEGFIVGGKYARIEEYPHSAFLAISCLKLTYEDFTCGSSILNQWILLTAAHCLDQCRRGTTILVAVGAAKRTRGTFYNVKKFTNHGQYDGDIMQHDIAVAMLTKPLVFSSKVKRVRLSKVGIYDEPAVLAGWGVTNEEEYTETVYLKSTRQIVWQINKCLKKLPDMTEGYFCASADKYHKGYGYAAVGDSGSALIVRGSVQIGIVSYKITETSKSLIVYTDVWQYYRWIEITSKKLFCPK